MPREPLLSVGHLSVRLGDRESAAPSFRIFRSICPASASRW